MTTRVGRAQYTSSPARGTWAHSIAEQRKVPIQSGSSRVGPTPTGLSVGGEPRHRDHNKSGDDHRPRPLADAWAATGLCNAAKSESCAGRQLVANGWDGAE